MERTRQWSGAPWVDVPGALAAPPASPGADPEAPGGIEFSARAWAAQKQEAPEPAQYAAQYMFLRLQHSFHCPSLLFPSANVN